MEVCQICKEKMEIVGDYHCEKHNLTVEEYRAKYGRVYDNRLRLPPRQPLADREYIGYAIDSMERRRRREPKWRLR